MVGTGKSVLKLVTLICHTSFDKHCRRSHFKLAGAIHGRLDDDVWRGQSLGRSAALLGRRSGSVGLQV
jgi:hypothetical protein